MGGTIREGVVHQLLLQLPLVFAEVLGCFPRLPLALRGLVLELLTLLLQQCPLVLAVLQLVGEGLCSGDRQVGTLVSGVGVGVMRGPTVCPQAHNPNPTQRKPIHPSIKGHALGAHLLLSPSAVLEGSLTTLSGLSFVLRRIPKRRGAGVTGF